MLFILWVYIHGMYTWTHIYVWIYEFQQNVFGLKDIYKYVYIHLYHIWKEKSALYILFSYSNFDYVEFCLISLCKRTETKISNETYSKLYIIKR